MKKNYTAPQLIDHGTVENITNFFGGSSTDVLTGPDGNVAATGNGSIDACAQQGGQCLPH